MPNVTYARSQGRNRFGRRRYGPLVTKGYLKSIIGVPESKWINTVVAPTAVPSTIPTGPPDAQNTCLNLISQGTTQSTRIGNEVSNRSLHVRLLLQRAAVDSVVRVIIFWCIDGYVASGALISNLLEDPSSWQSPLNKDYGKSFWVRFDRTYTLAAGQTQLQVEEVWRKLKCKTEYALDTSNIPSHNALYMVAISNQTVLANQPLISYTARLNYMDL